MMNLRVLNFNVLYTTWWKIVQDKQLQLLWRDLIVQLIAFFYQQLKIRRVNKENNIKPKTGYRVRGKQKNRRFIRWDVLALNVCHYGLGSIQNVSQPPGSIVASNFLATIVGIPWLSQVLRTSSHLVEWRNWRRPRLMDMSTSPFASIYGANAKVPLPAFRNRSEQRLTRK